MSASKVRALGHLLLLPWGIYFKNYHVEPLLLSLGIYSFTYPRVFTWKITTWRTFENLCLNQECLANDSCAKSSPGW